MAAVMFVPETFVIVAVVPVAFAKVTRPTPRVLVAEVPVAEVRVTWPPKRAVVETLRPRTLRAPVFVRVEVPERVREEVGARVEEAEVVKKGMAPAVTEAAVTFTFPLPEPKEAQVVVPVGETVVTAVPAPHATLPPYPATAPPLPPRRRAFVTPVSTRLLTVVDPFAPTLNWRAVEVVLVLEL